MNQPALMKFADELDIAMSTISRMFMKNMHARFMKMKITMPQVMILHILGKEKQMKMSDLAKTVGVTTAAVTGMSDRLVRDGYVKRVRDADDRRIVFMRLSQKGAKAAKDMMSERRKMTMQMFSKVSQSDRDEYLRILKRIGEGLK